MADLPDQAQQNPASDHSALAPEGFGTRVRSALAWRYGSQIAAQIITWSSTILVVRLLDPSDYGLFAMTQVVLAALAFINGYSFATTLIQQETITRREIGQVFALLLMMNTILGVTQFLMAPVAARYFGQPMVAEMLRIQSLLYITTPFIALPSALLARNIAFRQQGLASMVGAVSGAITALALAWYGYGVWALVYAPLVAFGARAIVLTIAARLLVMPVFDFRGARALVTFGGALTLCQFFWIIQSQSDIFIAGRSFETYELGLYAEALFLTLIVTGRFLPPLNEVAFPAYSELHKSGRSLAPYFERTVRSVAIVTAPIYIGLSLTAYEAVETLFGEKWVPMSPIVQGLALVMPLFALQIICSPATNALGRPRVYVTTSAIGASLFLACFLVGARFGPMGLVQAWWVAASLLFVVTYALTMRHVGLSFVNLMKALTPAFIGCATMALLVIGVDSYLPEWPAWLRLICLGAAGALGYGLVLLIGFPEVVKDSYDFLRQGRSEPAISEESLNSPDASIHTP
jgi:O-antigen/teichoic acid export membrane protein